MLESLLILMFSQIPIKNINGKSFKIFCFKSYFFYSYALAVVLLLGVAKCVLPYTNVTDSVPLGFEISGFDRYVDDNGKDKKLVSENEVFEFGFFERNGGVDDEFVVGIRYNLGPKSANLPVWTVGGGVRVSMNSTFRLSMDGRLILFENPSNFIVWSSDTSNSGVERATLLNNGNLVLMGSQNRVIWESFDRPTNTLLPGQSLRFPQNLRAPLTKSTTSYYTCVIHQSEGLALMWESNVTYWRSQTSNSAIVKEARFDSNGVFGLYDDTSKVVWSISSKDFGETSVSLRHLRMDQDGNLRIYSWDNVVRTWRVGWQAVEDQCNVFGSCGLYSVCGYNSTSPVCDCLYSDSLDWGNGIPQSDSSGCKKMVDLRNCKAHTSMIMMERTVLYGLYPPHDVDMMLSEDACKDYCANDTTCFAMTSKNDGSGLCTLKRTSFVSGYTGPSVPSTSFLKVCLVPQAVAAQGAKPNKSRLKTFPFGAKSSYKKVTSAMAFVVFVTVSVTLCLEMSVLLYIYRRRRNNTREGLKEAKMKPQYNVLMRLSFKEVQELTSDFSTQLGSSVFKGQLPEEMVVVAKVIKESVLSEKEFLKVVSILGGTHHRNLVSIQGFCSEMNNKVLIYEYVPNGSADKWLFDFGEGQRERNWQQRLDIAIGVTRALAYLHTECQRCITHGNLKLENVLLDEKLVPKLTDFGIQTFLQVKKDPLTSSSSSNESPSEKDMYMLGKLLLEIVMCGRDTLINSLDQVMEKLYQEQKYLDQEDLRGVERVVRIALWCMQSQPFLRPSVGEVLKVLEGTLSVDRPPSSFAYRNGIVVEEKNDTNTDEIELVSKEVSF